MHQNKKKIKDLSSLYTIYYGDQFSAYTIFRWDQRIIWGQIIRLPFYHVHNY